MKNKFWVTVPCYNCDKWIKKSLRSIYEQSYDNYKVIIVDDGSTDNTREYIDECLAEFCDERFSLIRNESNLGSPIGSIVKAIDSAEIPDDDVIVNIDGDDWLPDNGVFEHLNEVYEEDVLVTYGQFAPSSGRYANICKEVPNTRTYRRSRLWYKRMHASHLRTFKKKVFDKINRSDFMDFEEPDKFLQFAGDMALIFAMLEIAGNSRAKFIDRVMYIYNDENEISEMYLDAEKQMRYADIISTKPVYQEVTW